MVGDAGRLFRIQDGGDALRLRRQHLAPADARASAEVDRRYEAPCGSDGSWHRRAFPAAVILG